MSRDRPPACQTGALTYACQRRPVRHRGGNRDLSTRSGSAGRRRRGGPHRDPAGESPERGEKAVGLHGGCVELAIQERRCLVCRETKSIAHFAPHGKSGRPRSWCRPCVREYKRVNRHRWASKPRNAVQRRAAALLTRYGITPEDYQRLLDTQGGVCAICLCGPGERKFHTSKRLHVDHCHVTGRVRGLLCGPCNTAIGSMLDNRVYLERAAAYLASRTLH